MDEDKYNGSDRDSLNFDLITGRDENREPPNSQPYYYSSDKKKNKKGPKFIIWALVFSLIGGLAGGGFSYLFFKNQNPAASNNIRIETSGSMDQVEAVAAKAMPSVVGITTKDIQMTPFGPVPVEGSGSGFIVSEDGYIMSNAHVVGEKNNRVHVLLDDGSQAEGRVVWSAEALDLGLVKIDKKGLQPIELGDSDKVSIGQLAVAIGNPLGLDFQRTVTAGVISGLNRNIGEVEGNYMDGLIQTDASINSGNSGGPLLDKGGRVIGINSVKVASAEGIGFSIPINTIKPIIDQVIKTGDYKSVALGIMPVSVSNVESRYKLDLGTQGKGIVVFQVEPGSPAEKAGLKTYDIILGLGGKDLDNTEQLRRELYKHKVGDKVKLTIIRDGKKKDMEVAFSSYQVADPGDPSQIKPYKE